MSDNFYSPGADAPFCAESLLRAEISRHKRARAFIVRCIYKNLSDINNKIIQTQLRISQKNGQSADCCACSKEYCAAFESGLADAVEISERVLAPIDERIALLETDYAGLISRSCADGSEK